MDQEWARFLQIMEIEWKEDENLHQEWQRGKDDMKRDEILIH
mgnify:CR=1 FL=1